MFEGSRTIAEKSWNKFLNIKMHISEAFDRLYLSVSKIISCQRNIGRD